MSTNGKHLDEPRYVLTEAGRYASLTAMRCSCEVHITGLVVQCVLCGTVFGYTRDVGKARGPVWKRRA